MAAYPIVVLLSGNGSNLQAIIDRVQQQQLAIDIKAVISDQPNAYGLQRAQQAHIPTEIISPCDYTNKNDFNAALLTCIQKYHPQLVVLAGFMRILNSTIIEAFPQRIINLHPSLLPKYRGLNTHARALAAGDHEHGTSVHIVVPELDAGPVLAQAKLTINSKDTADTLRQRVQQLEHQLYPIVLDWFANQRIQCIKGQFWLDQCLLPSSGKQFTMKQLQQVQI
ncbi:MAG: phosphoribosylglycinamide formyltransferase [Gammaproteobacteria bacterium]